MNIPSIPGAPPAVYQILRQMFGKSWLHTLDIANGAVTNEKIADGAITFDKLPPNLIPANQRQMVWQGIKYYLTDNSGFLVAISGQLKITLLATAVPFIFTIADGYDKTKGQIDYIFGIDSDVIGAWTLPPNKAFLQLWIEYNPTTKAVTYGYSELPWAWNYPGSPSVDQHWTDIENTWITQRWDGEKWEKKIRLAVGECATGASSVSSVIAYAVKRQYCNGVFVIANNQTYNKPANLGIPEELYKITALYRKNSNFPWQPMIASKDGTNYYGATAWANSRTNIKVKTATNYVNPIDAVNFGSSDATNQTIGEMKIIATSAF
jgi:hypothetical protein